MMFTSYAYNDLFPLPDPEQQEIYACQTLLELQAFSSTGPRPKQPTPASPLPLHHPWASLQVSF